jgi:hypothetical protein
MFFKKKILFISLLFLLMIVNHQINGQINSENVNKKIFIPNEDGSPSLFTPKKESPFLNEDPFKKKSNDNPNEQFIDPSVKYLKKLNKKKEEDQNPNNFRVDQYLGDFKNNGKFVQIALRDHESPDGDLIKIMLNDKEVIPRILLQEQFIALSLNLMVGFNKIDFVALNQGSSGPNTAEVRVFDDQGNLIGSNRWNLATGVKATYIIIKEK